MRQLIHPTCRSQDLEAAERLGQSCHGHFILNYHSKITQAHKDVSE